MNVERPTGRLPEELGLRTQSDNEGRRYWRSQGNRRVRKARRTRNLARWLGIGALQIAFGSLVAYTALGIWERVSRSEEFALTRIELVGVERADRAAILDALAPYRGRFLPDLNLDELDGAVRRDPWVRDASLKLLLPQTLRVEVRERTPCAVAIIGGLAHVVDCAGWVIGPSGTETIGELPVLTGLAGPDTDRLPGDLARGVALLARLREAAPAFVDALSELDLSRRDRITARTMGDGPLVLLDPEQVDRNVERFLALWPAMSERVGTMTMVDLRWRDRVAVLPAAPAAATAAAADETDES